MIQILFVEDNESLRKGLTYTLEKEGFRVDACGSARTAEEKIDSVIYDLAILDIALPETDTSGTAGQTKGYDICRYLKEARPETPVIFLTAKDEENDVVRGLDLGADDYVIKPFRNRELISRVNSVLRRYHKSTREIVTDHLRLDLVAGRLFRTDGKEIELTALEYRIVVLLMQNRGITMTREKILDRIWDYAGDVVNDNTLTVYIKRIREKLGDDAIKTIRGIGYRMD